MTRLRLLAATSLALALACSGLDGDEQSKPPVEVVAVEAPAPPPSGQVGAYYVDCAAPMMVEDEMEGGTVPACSLLEFDQMCAPDVTGCWDRNQGCEAACVAPCGDCEARCATDCGSCKDTCGSDDACLRTCAEARLSCQERCLTEREGCLSACDSAESTCYSDFQQKLEEVCPSCTEISRCLVSDVRQTAGGCQAKFPSADKRCFEWCEVY